MDTVGLSALGGKISDAFSVHAGLRHITISGDFTTVFPSPYSSSCASGSDLGYVVVAAFENREFALRVALTYSWTTHFDLDRTAGDAVADMPQSINLEAQSGIAANTRLFGSIRWADWTEARIIDTAAGTLIAYDKDVFTYSPGVGRKFLDSFSGSISLGHEASQGGLAFNLAPTDGQTSVGIDGKFTSGSMKISAGVRYVRLGDASTESLGNVFTDNTAIGAGVKVAFRF